MTATDMVAADVRTPPKVKSQMIHSHLQSLMTPGKGEAIPVVLEGNDEAALEKISSDNFKYTHSDPTPSSGLSTWILLNSDTVSTPYSHHKKVQKPTSDAPSTTSAENIIDSKKKPAKSTTTTTTTEKVIKSKIESVVMKKPERKPIATIQKVNQTHAKKPTTPKLEPEEIPTTTVVSLQDSKFKNKTPVVVGKVPSTNTKEVVNTTTPMTFVEMPFDNNTRLGTPVVTFPHVPVRRHNSTTTRRPSNTTKPTMVMISSGAPTKFASVQEYPMASTVAVTGQEVSSVSTEETQSEAVTETTTKKTTTGGKKKKKNKNKNKNKRRRPTKKPAKIQSKISEDDNSTSKLPAGLMPGGRPLSTRIYNYLAREVMPNVGVGLVGLMLTAGLAGLLLYPFGGAIPVRRNYEKPGPTYNNLNDYPPIGEVDNAQPEESVLSQVLAGMSSSMNQYSREQPDVLYKTHPKYKPARYDNPNTYNHHTDVKYTTEATMEDYKYSELGDVVSGPHESVKFTSFDINDSIKYPMDDAEPSPGYSSVDLTTSSQNEPIYHKYPVNDRDPIKHESPVYSTMGEYASYSNPHEPMQNPVYNGETYDYKNHKNSHNSQEYKVSSEVDVVTQAAENQTTTTKVKHEQPSFAALEGIPKNYRTLQTSIRFEDTASVLPMNQDFVPSDAVFAASIEHGPRNMKLQRKKRNTSSENEVDSVLIDSMDKSENSQSPVQFISTEATEKATTTAPVSTTELEKPTTKHFDIVEMITKATQDFKQLISTTETIESFESKNKSEPVVVTPETGYVSENISYFVPTLTSTKVEIVANTNSTCENCDLSNIEEHPPSPQPFSISILFRKILDFKFRIGYEIIRATTDVISKYLSTVQQRMTETLRDLQRSAFGMNTDKKSTKSSVMKKRQRRHIVHGS